MTGNTIQPRSGRARGAVMFVLAGILAAAGISLFRHRDPAAPSASLPAAATPEVTYEPRKVLETSGILSVVRLVHPWKPEASLEEIARSFRGAGHQIIRSIDEYMATSRDPEDWKVHQLVLKSSFHSYEGEPERAYEVLVQARSSIEASPPLRAAWLYTVIYLQGVASLRLGEDENCILCRGESSCILPIVPAAVHVNPRGSRQAIVHFTEYLERFPEDEDVRWLLNVAHMTLAEHPQKVDPRWVIELDAYRNSGFDIGRFRDVGQQTRLNRLNWSGGAVMDDFDNDGLLDIVTTTFDPAEHMSLRRNDGTGEFTDVTAEARLLAQLGGLYCVQADFNDDGFLDLHIPRGAWMNKPMRPTLLMNLGDGTFADVTESAGAMYPMNSISSSWNDYDRDGLLDLFVCGEAQPNRLLRNRGDGTFEEIAGEAGVDGAGQLGCKGTAWIDFDNDGDDDLFLSYMTGRSHFFENMGNGAFREITLEAGIDGPEENGFSCWAWDYDNDGWQDLFVTCYDRSIGDVVRGLVGRPHHRRSNRLFHNLRGARFENVTAQAGLDLVFATMGSNYADFDNDGYLDMYLGTGEPRLETLVPNRMFRNVAGSRFAEITGSSRTGNLQKGHAVACGDWDRDHDVDLFIQMGGASHGDRYHNVLFQNPGQPHPSITLKLVGTRSNRSAIGARVRIETAGAPGQVIHRHISTGSSFGANPLEQTIGLGAAQRVVRIEIRWPASGAVQSIEDVAIGTSMLIVEGAPPRRLESTPIEPPGVSAAFKGDPPDE